jgi:hypothetical protein
MAKGEINLCLRDKIAALPAAIGDWKVELGSCLAALKRIRGLLSIQCGFYNFKGT